MDNLEYICEKIKARINDLKIQKAITIKDNDADIIDIRIEEDKYILSIIRDNMKGDKHYGQKNK